MKHTQTQLNLLQKAMQFERLENFVDALKLMHLFELVKRGGPFTIFAPTDSAFMEMPEYLTEAIEGDNRLLSTLLQYHIIPGKYYSTELTEQGKFLTLIGEDIFTMEGKEKIWINKASIIEGDHETSNGVLHIIDKLLIPATFRLGEFPQKNKQKSMLLKAS